MKRNMVRKIISVVLCVAMMAALGSTAFAADAASIGGFESSVSDDGRIGISSFILDGNAYTLRTEEMDNGDIVFYEYLNDQLMHRAMLYNDQRDRLHKTSYVVVENSRGRTIEIIETVEILEMPPVEIFEYHNTQSFQATAGVIMGVVRFRNLSTSIGPIPIHGVRVSSSVGGTTLSQYIIRDRWTTIAELAGRFLWAFSIPGIAAGAAAAWIVFIAGTAVDVGGRIFLGHTEVQSRRNPVTFTMENVDILSHRNSFIVDRFIVSCGVRPHLQNQTYWGGFDHMGHTPTLWRTWDFAREVQFRMFSFPVWDIHSWT
ncbi:MAG: hypothetical protein FWC90_03430 [Oscillospiraceae bacterium]|nr:hypothetical protein [Oscillospiraceae bacterium]